MLLLIKPETLTASLINDFTSIMQQRAARCDEPLLRYPEVCQPFQMVLVYSFASISCFYPHCQSTASIAN